MSDANAGQERDPPTLARRRTQDERSEEMRARLLEAAIKVLQQRGYSGFRIAEVAATAGVSRGAQIHHYPTKDSLVAACLEHVFQSVLHATQAEVAAVRNDDEVMERASKDAHDFFFSDNFFIALDILMSGGKNALVADSVRAISTRNRLPAEQAWVDRFAASGLDRKDAETHLWLLWSVLRGLAIRREIGGDLAREQRVVQLTLELLKGNADSLRKR